MKVCHGSDVEVINVDLAHSQMYKDFGPGFYVSVDNFLHLSAMLNFQALEIFPTRRGPIKIIARLKSDSAFLISKF